MLDHWGGETMNFELAGFVIGIFGAMLMKVSINLLRQEKENAELLKLLPPRESVAVTTFLNGLSLVLLGLGLEPYWRLFYY
jgi:hypothetical protein